jgi:hypothetical protein
LETVAPITAWLDVGIEVGNAWEKVMETGPTTSMPAVTKMVGSAVAAARIDTVRPPAGTVAGAVYVVRAPLVV